MTENTEDAHKQKPLVEYNSDDNEVESQQEDLINLYVDEEYDADAEVLEFRENLDEKAKSQAEKSITDEGGDKPKIKSMVLLTPTLTADAESSLIQSLAGAAAVIREATAEFKESIVASREKNLEIIEKNKEIMDGAKAMIDTLAQMAKDNVEAERLKLRRLEVTKIANPVHLNKTLGPVNIKRKITDSDRNEFLNPESKKTKEEDSIIVDTNKTAKLRESTNENEDVRENLDLNKEVEIIKRTLEQEMSHPRIFIKRDYKLTEKSNFNIWMDYLKSELTSNDLIDLIDPSKGNNQDRSETTILRRKALVRDIIVNHLNENCHKKILNIEEPLEIIQK